jgi:hypothetical protein
MAMTPRSDTGLLFTLVGRRASTERGVCSRRVIEQREELFALIGICRAKMAGDKGRSNAVINQGAQVVFSETCLRSL